MIKIDRTEKPLSLVKHGQRWTDELLEKIAENGGDGSKVDDKYWRKYNTDPIKRALRAMFNGKCAYCEAKIVHIGYPHIEHYQPKSKYPDKTFLWVNLLSACSICNGASYKGDRFPLDENNDPLLLDPCSEDPKNHIRFHKARVVGFSKMGEKSEEVYGLNRDELYDYRREYRLDFLAIIKLLESSHEDDDQDDWQMAYDRIVARMSKKSAHTGMFRQVFLDEMVKITDTDLLDKIQDLIALANGTEVALPD